MATNMGTLNPEQMLEQQQILRQQKMAEMLMQQGMQQPQGQMISGHYVAPSFTQNLAGLANMYVGQRAIEKGDQAQIDLAKRLRADEASATADYMKERIGTPAEMYPAQAGPMPTGGNIPLQESKAAVPANPQAAYFNLYANPKASAAQRQFAFGKMTADPKEFDLTEGQKRFVAMPDGTYKEIASGGEKTSSDYKDYQIAVKDPVSPFKGSFLDYQIGLKKAGASNITIPTEGERKAGFMSNILDRNILQMQTALGVDPKAVKPNVPASIASALTGPNLLSRSMTPAQRQIVEDSQLDVLDAALTLRTGAAYTPVQLTAMRETYFPVLGDKPPAIKAKKERLETLLEGAYIAAGRAMPQRVSAPPSELPPPQPNLNQQFGVPAIKAPIFRGFEPSPTGQQ
jgi:hypothetical protein